MLRACDWWSVAGSPASDDQPMGGDPSASAATVLTQFSERQRGQALDRFGVLRAHVEDKVPLAEIARQHKLPLRTLVALGAVSDAPGVPRFRARRLTRRP